MSTTTMADKGKGTAIAVLTPQLTRELYKLANGIRSLHEACVRHAVDSLWSARGVGDELLEAKELVPHGGWLPFLKDCGVPERTARAYMDVARNWDKLTAAKSAAVADLTLRAALESLAEDRQRLKRVQIGQPAEAPASKVVTVRVTPVETSASKVSVVIAKPVDAEDVRPWVKGGPVHLIDNLEVTIKALEEQSLLPVDLARLRDVHARLGKLLEGAQ